MGSTALSDAVTAWYRMSMRDLPWRVPGASPYAVLVSEVMLQQTPVARVLPAYGEWLRRWPDVADLAGAAPADVVRQWGRLGYPRRALRLHQAAATITSRHGGQVPDSLPDLLALPGVGAYTARAVLAFAFGRRVGVVDTNVRRAVARSVEGACNAPVRAGDHEKLLDLLPRDAHGAVLASAAWMELGALVCTARSPACGDCPLATRCRWRATGSPVAPPARRTQQWVGSDRQARGRLMALLRGQAEPVDPAAVAQAWPPVGQRARALDSLVADGLAQVLPDGRVALPGPVPR